MFIILIYGLLNVLTEKPAVCGQGADMSLRRTCLCQLRHQVYSMRVCSESMKREAYIYHPPIALPWLTRGDITGGRGL